MQRERVKAERREVISFVSVNLIFSKKQRDILTFTTEDTDPYKSLFFTSSKSISSMTK